MWAFLIQNVVAPVVVEVVAKIIERYFSDPVFKARLELIAKQIQAVSNEEQAKAASQALSDLIGGVKADPNKPR